MSDSDPMRLTPVPYAPFDDTILPTKRDTMPTAAPDSAPMNDHPSIDDLTRAMARLESDLDEQAKKTQRALEEHTEDAKASVNAFLNTVLQKFSEGTLRMDKHAKVIRALNAEAQHSRVLRGEEPSAALSDDL